MGGLYTDVLVHVDATVNGRRRLKQALRIAECFNVRLTGLHVRTPVEPPPLYKPSVLQQVVRVEEQRREAGALASKALFDQLTSGVAFPVRWRSVRGHLAPHICRQARYADLVIVGQGDYESPPEHHLFSLAEDVVRMSGRPVMVCPRGEWSFRLRHVAIAWDGSREAVRALHDAIPILAAAAEVWILEIDEPWPLSRPRRVDEELREHLVRHGVRSEIRQLPVWKGNSKELIERLEADGLDLLIMGAFGHSAWSELFLGGTTEDVLRSSCVPLVFAH